MKELGLYVTTYGRSDKQITLSNIPSQWLYRTTLVVQEREAHLYDYPFSLWVLPDYVRGLSPTRQFVIENTRHRYICLLDDDLYFYVRHPKGKLVRAGEFNVAEMFQEQEYWLQNGFAHCGVSPQAGNFREKQDVVDVRFTSRVISYDVKKIPPSRFDRVPVMQTMDMTLQLFRRGLPNRISYRFAHAQRAEGSPGGCSEYRTRKMVRDACKELVRLHPEFVRLRYGGREYGGRATGGHTLVRWKKAYEEGIKTKAQRIFGT